MIIEPTLRTASDSTLNCVMRDPLCQLGFDLGGLYVESVSQKQDTERYISGVEQWRRNLYKIGIGTRIDTSGTSLDG